MEASSIVLFVVLLSCAVLAVDSAAAEAVPSEPTYQRQAPDAAYVPQVPHTTYPHVENTYGMRYDGGNSLDVPAPYPNYQNTPYQTSVIPSGEVVIGFITRFLTNLGLIGIIALILIISALQLAVRVAARVGLFLIGGVALLVIGGVFTTALCSMTPLCTITFHGISGLNKETVRTVRSLITPENLSEASSFLQNAVSKYNKLQMAVNGPSYY